MANFTLRWVASEKALHMEGAWHLVPRTPEAYEYASRNLKNDWVDGIQAGKSKREIFLFRPGKVNAADVFKSLAAAGIKEADVVLEQKGLPPELGPLFSAANA